MTNERFTALDGLRGLAAISVLIYHLSGHKIMSGAWVSVDFFFILSGFVICHGYGPKIADGLGFKEFLVLRLVRLYPLYLAGTVIGLATYTAAHSEKSSQELLTLLIQGIFFIPQTPVLPWPFDTSPPLQTNFPLNGPAWSLWFEVMANIGFFFIGAAWLVGRRAALLALLYIAFILCTIISGQTPAGWSFNGFLIGLLRVGAEFLLGAFIYTHRRKIPATPTYVKISVIALFFVAFFSRSIEIALINSLTLAPMSIAVACSIKLEGKCKQAADWLGDISYPLYILHAPIQRGLFELNWIESLPLAARVLLITSIFLPIAWAAGKFDTKIRRRLMHRLRESYFLQRAPSS